MKDILFIAKSHITAALRERITLFWFLIFPIFLLVILTLIFGQLGNEGEINFEITLINRESPSVSNFAVSNLIVAAFSELAQASDGTLEPLFTLHTPGNSVDRAQFQSSELAELRRGRRAAVLVIPEEFDQSVLATLGQVEPREDTHPSQSLQLYMSSSNVASSYASQIIEQVIAAIDRQILLETGRMDASRMIGSETHWIGQASEDAMYVDFVLPGIILMGFFVNGLFGVPGTILFNRQQKVLRRYWVTPLSVSRYLAGFALGHLALCVVQFVLLVMLGIFAFGASIRFSSVASIGLLVLAAITFMAFGFLIAALAKTANSGMATANILNTPMLFLSGMFFPVSGLPPVIMVLFYLNPVSYLLDGLRTSVGVQATTLLPGWSILCAPLAWIILSSRVASRRLKWDVER